MTTKVHSTDNYGAFKRIEGNRTIKPGHITKLQQSLSQDPALAAVNPIIVNDEMEIIDGQHRFEALKRLHMPVHYLQMENIGLHEVQKLNANTKVWTPMDYAKSYAELGVGAYITLLNLYSSYHRVFSLDFIVYSLTNATENGSTESYKNGRLKINTLDDAKIVLNALVEVGEYYSDYKLRTFMRAFRKIFLHSKYNHTRFMNKLKKHASKIQPFHTVEDAQREIERIYNMNSSDSQRIRFF